MKLPKQRIGRLAESIIRRLQGEGCLDVTGEQRAALAGLEHAITDELLVEDRLNAEIKELMKAYEPEIEKGRVDDQKMFTMIKTKLVKDRGLIL